MKKRALIILSCMIFFGAITSFGQKRLTVAAAANVQFVMDELKKDFEKLSGTEVNVILNSSGKLTAQIREGAPYDIFVSADMKYPEELYKSGFTLDSPKVYANGVLVFWTTRTDIKPSTDLKILPSVAIKKIAIANPQT